MRALGERRHDIVTHFTGTSLALRCIHFDHGFACLILVPTPVVSGGYRPITGHPLGYLRGGPGKNAFVFKT